MTWWEGAKNYRISHDLANRAITLLSDPPSSASIERVSSNFGAIHNRVRNRLGNEKALNLCFVIVCYVVTLKLRQCSIFVISFVPFRTIKYR